VALGALKPAGPLLRAAWEDVLLAIMAPRAGKTTSLAVPMTLDAPGAVIATSNKADLVMATHALRRARGRCWVFDPQGIAHTPRRFTFNPLADVATVEAAARLAGHFIQEIADPRKSGDFWTKAAADLLTSLILAAALDGRDLAQVYRWLNDSAARRPVALLHDHGHPALAAGVEGRQAGAVETREGIYETARTAAQALRDPAIMAWVTPDSHLPPFTPAGFPASTDTVYAMSKDGGGSAAPLVAALVDALFTAGQRHAEAAAGRLDPPMVAVLDEAANVAKIADLPQLYSHLGSRGIVPVTILQSYQQGAGVWGDGGMGTLWGAATIKLIGAGIDDPKLADEVSKLVGEHDVTVRSVSDGRNPSASHSLRRQRILPPEAIRALPRGQALLLATGTRAALLDLHPWYRGPRAAAITAASTTATARITTRAAAAHPTVTHPTVTHLTPGPQGGTR
ncbi:MAG: TraM recognition domain-containing protein, partial [Propionicimonas sp.]